MTEARHTARDVAQVLTDRKHVADVQVVTDGDGKHHVEITTTVDHIPPAVNQTLGEWGFGINPSLTAARLDEEHGWITTVAAFEVGADE